MWYRTTSFNIYNRIMNGGGISEGVDGILRFSLIEIKLRKRARPEKRSSLKKTEKIPLFGIMLI